VFDILCELQEEADKVQEAHRENTLAGYIFGVLLCAAVYCVVMCCSVLFCAAMWFCVLQCGVVCSVVLCAAVCCCVLQCVGVCCMHLNRTLPHLSTFVVHCSVLLCAAKVQDAKRESSGNVCIVLQ